MLNLDTLERWIAPLKRRVMQMVSRGIVNQVSDTDGLQKLQVSLLADELHSNVERVGNYGFTSVPKAGAEVLFASVGGSREHGIIVGVEDRRFRLKNLAPGEVAIYTDEGDKIILRRGKQIQISSGGEIDVIAATKVVVQAVTVEVQATTANITASGAANITAPNLTIAASGGVTMNTPTLNVSGVVNAASLATGAGAATVGSLVATGNISDAGGSMAQIRTKYNGHTHPETGTTTGAPTPSM